MNGSKNLLLAAILVLALLPGALLLVVANSDQFDLFAPAAEEDPGAAALRQAEAERREAVILGFEEEIRDLKTRLDLAEAKLEEEREEKLAALENVARLQKEYNSALSEVVRLKTERMEAAPPPPREPAPRETRRGETGRGPGRDSPERAPRTPDTGGWILPPSN
ncbi:MAG: hypothetical protein ACLFRP_01960 [Puniceicoccaceae bacterium]